MASRFLIASTGSACALALLLPACSDRKPASPLQPAPAPVPTSLTLAGPATVEPGAAASFVLTARFSNGEMQTVTNDATWTSSDPAILLVERGGQARAIARGEATVRAQFGAQGSQKAVLVLPDGTFRLAGQVTEAGSSGFGVPDVRVDVVAGEGAGLSATTDGSGRYGLFGVRGDIMVRYTRANYDGQEKVVPVRDHAVLDVALVLRQPRPDVAGTYALILEADRSCAAELPEGIRSRRYTAQLVQNGPNVEAKLSGASFHVTKAGGDRLRGLVEPDGMRFELRPHVYRYYGYAQYPDIVEKLPEHGGYFAVDGSVFARAVGPNFEGTLRGAYQYFRWDPSFGGTPTTQCKGNHRFVLSPTSS